MLAPNKHSKNSGAHSHAVAEHTTIPVAERRPPARPSRRPKDTQTVPPEALPNPDDNPIHITRSSEADIFHLTRSVAYTSFTSHAVCERIGKIVDCAGAAPRDGVQCGDRRNFLDVDRRAPH